MVRTGAKQQYEKDGVKQIPIDRIYCEVVLYCHEINVWGHGKVKVEEKIREKNVEVEAKLIYLKRDCRTNSTCAVMSH